MRFDAMLRLEHSCWVAVDSSSAAIGGIKICLFLPLNGFMYAFDGGFRCHHVLARGSLGACLECQPRSSLSFSHFKIMGFSVVSFLKERLRRILILFIINYNKNFILLKFDLE